MLVKTFPDRFRCDDDCCLACVQSCADKPAQRVEQKRVRLIELNTMLTLTHLSPKGSRLKSKQSDIIRVMNQRISRIASLYYFAQNILQGEAERNNAYTLLFDTTWKLQQWGFA